MAPDLVAAFVDEFNAEMRNLAASAERETLADKRTLSEIERKLAAIVRAIGGAPLFRNGSFCAGSGFAAAAADRRQPTNGSSAPTASRRK